MELKKMSETDDLKMGLEAKLHDKPLRTQRRREPHGSEDILNLVTFE